MLRRFAIPLPPEQRASVGVLVGNYGEAGAVMRFWGRRAPSPPAPISMTEFGVAAWVSDATAYDADCGWIFAGICGQVICCLYAGGTQR